MQKMEGVQAQGMLVAETVKTMLADYKGKKLANLKKSESGLEYVIIEQGTGAPSKTVIAFQPATTVCVSLMA
jgi:hypothetical protein